MGDGLWARATDLILMFDHFEVWNGGNESVLCALIYTLESRHEYFS